MSATAPVQTRVDRFIDQLRALGRDSDKISGAVADELESLAEIVTPARGMAELLRMYETAVREQLGQRHPSLPFLRVYGEPPKRAERAMTIGMRIPAFLARIASFGTSPDPARVRGVVMLEQRNLKEQYKLNYVRVALTRYRAAAREIFGDGHPIIAMLHASNNDMEAIKAVERRLVFEQHSNLRPIDPDFFVDKARSLLYSGRYYPTFAGLLLVTGRRPAEIAFSADLRPVKGRADALLFSGQLKGRESENARLDPYEIPLLADADDVLEAFDFLRQYRTFEDVADVNRKTGKELNVAVRAAFNNQDALNGYQPKELRAVYAESAYDYLDDRSISKAAYFAQILGHSAGDIITANSYMKFYIIGKFNQAHRDYETSRVEMMIALEARQNATDDRVNAKAIGQDIQRITNATGATPAPRPTDQPAADLLTEHQQELLLDVLHGKRLFERRERTTVKALERRGLLTIAIDDSQRFAPEELKITSDGAELAARLQAGR
jgi:hypothetical protein